MCGWMVYVWLRWSWNARPDLQHWRGSVVLVSLMAATFSLAVVVGLFVRAEIHGGFRFMVGPQMVFMGLAFLAGVIGMVTALIGKGTPRWPSAVCSLYCLVALLVEFRAN